MDVLSLWLVGMDVLSLWLVGMDVLSLWLVGLAGARINVTSSYSQWVLRKARTYVCQPLRKMDCPSIIWKYYLLCIINNCPKSYEWDGCISVN